MEQEVSLIQMLDARERRVWHQQELLGAYGKPLVCFTMKIFSSQRFFLSMSINSCTCGKAAASRWQKM